MNKPTYLAAIFVLSAMIALTPIADAQQGPRNQQKPRDIFGRILYDLKDELALSDAQENDLKELERDHAKDVVVLEADATVLGIDLAALMEEQGNDSAVRTQHDSLQAKNDEIAGVNMDFQLDRRTLFTADQWALIIEELEALGEDRPEPEEREDDYVDRLAEIQEYCGLSDDQVADLLAIHDDAVAEAEGIREQIEPLREELRELMKTQGNDSEASAVDDEIESLKNEIGDIRLEASLESRAIYTADQWELYLDWREAQKYESKGEGQGRGPGRRN